MSDHDHPQAGGCYVRDKDGKLRRDEAASTDAAPAADAASASDAKPKSKAKGDR